MVCYAPGTGTLAVIGFAVYVFWHKAILHFFSMAGTAMEITLLLGTGALVAVLLSLDRAHDPPSPGSGRRVHDLPVPLPGGAQGSPQRAHQPGRPPRHPARRGPPRRPDLPPRRAPLSPLVSRLLSRRARPAAPAAAPTRRPASAATRPAARPASAATRPAARLRPASAPAHAAQSLRPASVPAAPRTSAPAAPRTSAPAFRATAPAREPWPLAPRPAVREPARPVETVPFDGYVLTPDGVDARRPRRRGPRVTRRPAPLDPGSVLGAIGMQNNPCPTRPTRQLVIEWTAQL